MRAGGKHNDLDEVGKTPRHHTFFEMLGNFSFGDYFKKDAIAWAWELLTEGLRDRPVAAVVTVFGGDKELAGVGADDEARAIWKKVTGFGDDRVIGLGKKDNFWEMGETGPMGPCTEIHFNFDGDRRQAGRPPIRRRWKGWLEIWNLVFMQFERREVGGPLHALPAPSVDTGAGLERVTSVVQGVRSNYDTDLFVPIIERAAEIAGMRVRRRTRETDTAMRVIADHARCSAFLIADGVFPDKGEREYMLRRIFRRAVRHGQQHLKLDKPFMHEVCDRGDRRDGRGVSRAARAPHDDPEGRRSRRRRGSARRSTRGLERLDGELARAEEDRRDAAYPGKSVFTMYDTFGFPDDLTKIIAEERGFDDRRGRLRGRARGGAARRASSRSDDAAIETVFKQLASEVGATKFTGYEGRGTTGEGTLQGDHRRRQARRARRRPAREVALVFDQTPFYAESGGQIGDTGAVDQREREGPDRRHREAGRRHHLQMRIVDSDQLHRLANNGVVDLGDLLYKFHFRVLDDDRFLKGLVESNVNVFVYSRSDKEAAEFAIIRRQVRAAAAERNPHWAARDDHRKKDHVNRSSMELQQ